MTLTFARVFLGSLFGFFAAVMVIGLSPKSWWVAKKNVVIFILVMMVMMVALVCSTVSDETIRTHYPLIRSNIYRLPV